MKAEIEVTMDQIGDFSFSDTTVRAFVLNDEPYLDVDDVIDALCERKPGLKEWLVNCLEGPITRDFDDMLTNVKIGKEVRRFAGPVALFRLIQAVPSRKAEELRRRLAETAFRQAQENANPELAVDRAITQFKKAGRSEAWIRARMRGIQARHQLTDEWKARGIQGSEYGVLTNVIHEETFAKNVEEHKQVKGLSRSHNLRDHMDELELTLTTLAEQTTTAIAKKRDAKGFRENKRACHEGGSIAGTTRASIEKVLGRDVVNPDNFLEEDQRYGLPPGKG